MFQDRRQLLLKALLFFRSQRQPCEAGDVPDFIERQRHGNAIIADAIRAPVFRQSPPVQVAGFWEKGERRQAAERTCEGGESSITRRAPNSRRAMSTIPSGIT